jgi:hypothetical protein
MPGPRYFDPFETPRSSDGKFAEKSGSSPEVVLDASSSAHDDAVEEARRILREEVYDDGQGFETREVSIDVDTLRALLPAEEPLTIEELKAKAAENEDMSPESRAALTSMLGHYHSISPEFSDAMRRMIQSSGERLNLMRTSSLASQPRVAMPLEELALADPEVRAAHERARTSPEFFSPADDLP